MAHTMTMPSRFSRFIPAAAVALLFTLLLISTYGGGRDGTKSPTSNAAKLKPKPKFSTGDVERDIEMSLDDIANATLGVSRRSWNTTAPGGHADRCVY